jgi:two-component system response regulator AtoC
MADPAKFGRARLEALLNAEAEGRPESRLRLLAREFVGEVRLTLGADRALLFLCPDSGDRASRGGPSAVAAVGSDGDPIAEADALIDAHFIEQVGRLDGARSLAGAEEGVSRPSLSIGFPLGERDRGVLIAEGAPGSEEFVDAEAQLETILLRYQSDLSFAHEFDLQARSLETTRQQLEELSELLGQRQLEIEGLRHAVDGEGLAAHDVTDYHQFLTCEPRVRELFSQVERIKDTDLSVLILGETGTGKELIARALHFGSERHAGPFEVVPCGSIASNLLESELFGYAKGAFSGADEDRDGFFVRAHGGTLLLDEVGDMPMSMQKQILRVLQERTVRPIGSGRSIPVDVRVVASTRADLESLVREQKFREDLLFRLDGFSVEIPPLRDRRDDIPLLIEHFLGEAAAEGEPRCSFSESAMRELTEYSWPGNVQELRNLVRRLVIESDRKVIPRRVVSPLLARGAEHLFHEEELCVEGEFMKLRIPARDGFNDIIAECERLILVQALRRHRGNKSRVTQQLGIPRQTLYNKLERHSIGEEEYLGGDDPTP